MSRKPSNCCGFEPRSIAFVELLTTAALALSTAVAVTAVSIGMARADAPGNTATSTGALLGVALLLGVVVSATVITAVMRTR